MAAAADPLALAEFEAGLDGLAENDLMDEAEVDSIVREAILHAVGDTPWADAKVGAAGARRATSGASALRLSHNPAARPGAACRWAPGRQTSSRPS